MVVGRAAGQGAAMTDWCGGSTAPRELEAFHDRTADLQPIGAGERRGRIAALQAAMTRAGLDAVYLDAGTDLAYFTGVSWHPSERLVGALVPAMGEPIYIVPFFERGTFESAGGLAAEIRCWHEDEDPARLLVAALGGARRLGLSAATPFGRVELVRAASPSGVALCSAQAVISACRIRKSSAEIALMQRAFDITLSVQKAAARILRAGMSTTEVVAFVDAAHRACGAGGSSFCIVLFGADTAFPHGVADPKTLEAGDMVLIDTGCRLHAYQSDVTRTYVFGEPTAHQRRVWNHESAAQHAAFAAATIGAPCGAIDDAVRRTIEAEGYGPGYALPGLPHRTDHGIGLDIHEPPYIVRGDATPLEPGFCFSIEPMLCVPGAFGVRLEDHVVMTDDGPRWFTTPSPAIDSPFGA